MSPPVALADSTAAEPRLPFGKPAMPLGRSDTDLRTALINHTPIRRAVRWTRMLLAVVSVAGFAGYLGLEGDRDRDWALVAALGSLALIGFGGLVCWPLARYGGWRTRSEQARVIGSWAQALVLGLGCLGLLLGLLLATDASGLADGLYGAIDSLGSRESIGAVAAIGGVLGITLGFLLPATVYTVLAARAADRERPFLERAQRLAHADEIAREVARRPERYPALPAPVVLRPDPAVDEPVTLEYREDEEDDEDDDLDPELKIRADRRTIVLTNWAGDSRTLRVSGRTAGAPTGEEPAGPVSTLVVLVAELPGGLTPKPVDPDAPTFDPATEARLTALTGDVDRVALLDGGGRRVVDLPSDHWDLRALTRLASAAGIECRAYRFTQERLDESDRMTPTGVPIDLLSAHHPAAPDLIDCTAP